MANELKFARGVQKTLEANGAAIANNAIGQADDADYLAIDTGDFLDAEFALLVNFTVAPTADRSIDLIIRPLNIDGVNDAPAPTATYRIEMFAFFVPNAATGAQYLRAIARNVPKEGQVWLYNNGTGQSMPLGWTLKMTPLTVAPT